MPKKFEPYTVETVPTRALPPADPTLREARHGDTLPPAPPQRATAPPSDGAQDTNPKGAGR